MPLTHYEFIVVFAVQANVHIIIFDVIHRVEDTMVLVDVDGIGVELAKVSGIFVAFYCRSKSFARTIGPNVTK